MKGKTIISSPTAADTTMPEKCEIERNPGRSKLHQCDICFLYFYRGDVLNVYKRVHLGETPYSCDVCFRSFAQLCTLNAHKRIHTGDNFLYCDVCYKHFSVKRLLEDHLHSHANGQK